jgi:hypothetical protein
MARGKAVASLKRGHTGGKKASSSAKPYKAKAAAALAAAAAAKANQKTKRLEGRSVD